MSVTDLEYNGQRLSDLGCMLCDFSGNSGIETVSIGSSITLNTLNRPSLKKFTLMSAKYEQPFSQVFQICKNPCKFMNREPIFSDIEISKLMRWLNKKTYHKFKMLYDDGKCSNMYYIGTFNDVKVVKLNEDIIGLEITFTANAPFGYYEPLSFEMDFSDAGTDFTIYDISDEIGYIYPNKLQITVLQDGDLKIKNSQETDTVIIKNCTTGEVITMDGENKVITSSIEHSGLYNDFNYNFIKIINKCGDNDDYFAVDSEEDEVENIFTTTLPCKIELTYSPICKMGVI